MPFCHTRPCTWFLGTAPRGGAAPPAPAPEWRAYGGTHRNHKYSALDQIDASNVDQLQIAWRWRSPALRFVYQATPLFVDGVLYTSTTASQVAAIDPATGEQLWLFDPGSYEAADGSHGFFVHRGVSFWEDGDDRRILVGTSDARLIALDADTGQPISSFGDSGRVDLLEGMRREADRDQIAVSSPPVVVGDVVVTGSPVNAPRRPSPSRPGRRPSSARASARTT